MARAMWRGAIQFGLVTIPVKLYLATEQRGGLSFHMLHKTCLNRVQMKTHCPEHGEITRSDTVRGFEWSKGQYVVIDEKDLESVPLKTVRAIEIDQFVEAQRGEYTTTFIKQCYYMEPEPVGRKAFYLLKSVLAETGLEGICKIVLKDREALAAINPYTRTMLLSTLYWPDEVRDSAELELPEEQFDFKPTEMQMARQLVETMTGEFDPSQYRDEYREALMQVIEAKVQGEPVEVPKAVEAPSKLTDLMAVLEASVEAARQSRGGREAAPRSASEATPATRRSARAPARDDAPTSVAEARKRKAASGAKSASPSGAKSASAATAKAARGSASRVSGKETGASGTAVAARAERRRKSA